MRNKYADSATQGSLKKTVSVVLTPAAKFGSWMWLADLMTFSPEGFEYEVVSYGKPQATPPNARVHALPDINYVRTGNLMSRASLSILNGLIYLPLLPIVFYLTVRRRARHLVANGVAAASIMLVVKYLTGAKLHLMFHGHVSHMSKNWQRAVGAVAKRCNTITVNSIGSRDDLATVVPADRIKVVEHWADPGFFDAELKPRAPGKLRVLYVGRLSDDKFAQCVRVMRVLATEGVAELHIAGSGPMHDDAMGVPGLVDLGYIGSKQELVSAYQNADIVWAPADSTYLSRPGIEGLASGCPVIVSDIPACLGCEHLQIPRSLVDPLHGWVVDGHDDAEALALLRRLSAEGISESMRQACRQFAIDKHSIANVRQVTQAMVDAQ